MSPNRARNSGCDSLGLGDHREGVEHLVVDQLAHGLPFAALGEPVQLVLQLSPAVEIEHSAIGGGRAVEGDLLSGRFRRRGHLLLGVPGDHEQRSGNLEPVEGQPRSLAAALQRWDRHLAQVALGREAVAEEAVADLTGDLGHQLPDAGEEHLRRAEPVEVGGVGSENGVMSVWR